MMTFPSREHLLVAMILAEFYEDDGVAVEAGCYVTAKGIARAAMLPTHAAETILEDFIKDGLLRQLHAIPEANQRGGGTCWQFVGFGPHLGDRIVRYRDEESTWVPPYDHARAISATVANSAKKAKRT